ncbi:MAG: hypothetical protein DUD39_03545 [Coriobacteriaceae bacterium]|nr:MAG: hypothetical protein DUD39_03545 [Coriobacteriaceae bacterium]
MPLPASSLAIPALHDPLHPTPADIGMFVAKILSVAFRCCRQLLQAQLSAVDVDDGEPVCICMRVASSPELPFGHIFVIDIYDGLPSLPESPA